MVIEFLTFKVPSEIRAKWESLDKEVWTRFLSTQKGFVKKELWQSIDLSDEVHAVIWWDSKESWSAITPGEISEVDKGMGDYLIEPEMKEFMVLEPSGNQE